MIKAEDLEKKALELYPDSEEQRQSFVAGCRYLAKDVFDRERSKKESARSKSEPFYDGFKNAIDGVTSYLMLITE